MSATMTSLLGKAVEKFPHSKAKSSNSGGAESPNRSIPPEPVQEQPQGNFKHQDREPALQALNLARANKSCKGVEWDDDLARQADEYAHTLAEKGAMQHSGVEGQGENLYTFGSSGAAEATYEDAVNAWLGEEKDYNGEKIGEGDMMKWGHFTQCLWSDTTKTGMGKAKSKDGMWFVVGRYTPQGNVAGQKPF